MRYNRFACIAIATFCLLFAGCNTRKEESEKSYATLAEGAARAKFHELENEIYEAQKGNRAKKIQISFSEFRMKYQKLSYAENYIAHHYLWTYQGDVDLGGKEEISVTVVPDEDDAIFAVFGNHWR